VIRSIWNGSMGPMMRKATVYDWVGDPVPGRYHLLHSGKRGEMLEPHKAYQVELGFLSPDKRAHELAVHLGPDGIHVYALVEQEGQGVLGTVDPGWFDVDSMEAG